ncbi:hypothetical protein [Rubidibacter lacunae]|nr:hypothetical protein [Rubidibacter lacunae]
MAANYLTDGDRAIAKHLQVFETFGYLRRPPIIGKYFTPATGCGRVCP